MINENIDVYTLIKPEIIKLRKAGIETANLDCRLLLSASLGKKSTIYIHESVNISENEIEIFRSLIGQRLSGKPVSRIINKRHFWKKEFKLNEETLDPRPDSETLIEAVLEHYSDKLQSLKILDLGSGSGCIGLSLLGEYNNSKVSFVDKSKKSLEIVKTNALNFGLSERSKFINLDWKVDEWNTKLIEHEKNIKFDIIVSNPPYIRKNEIKKLQNEVKDYDPIIALNGGLDGLDAYRFIMPKLKNIIKKNGKIFFEIANGQEHFITSMAIKHGLFPIGYKKDLSGVKRVIIIIFK